MRRYDPDGDGQYESPKPTTARPKWYESEDLRFVLDQPGVTRRKLDDSYRGVGSTWNRGHLAMKSHGSRLGWRQGCNTHFFSNAIPQFHTFDQGDWLDLEAYSGAVANKFGTVWVIAGPVFRVGIAVATIGDEGEVPVPIPHEVFRILIKDPADPRAALPDVLAFLYTNDAGDCARCGTAGHVYDHVDNLVTVKSIEEATGLTFFKNLALNKKRSRRDEQLRQLKETAASALWPVEERFYGVKCGR